MKRRSFLQGALPLLAAPFLLNGTTIRAFAKSSFINKLNKILSNTDKVLIVVQLQGGNDGLNTVIPLDQYSTYMSVRGNIAIPENSVLKLNDASGLHPAMTNMKNLFDDGKLALINAVSYPNPNLSHFRATDIWMSGSDYNQYLTTGWLGRYLDSEFPNYPSPDPGMIDPLAIQIGATIAFSMQGHSQSMGIALQDPNTFYQLVNGTTTGTFDTPPDTLYGHEVEYIRQIQLSSQQYSTQIKQAADKANNIATYPQKNTLADQLKITARLIAGGLKTRIYFVSLSGFDNHSAQVTSSDTSVGTHATLLGKVSDAISAFQSDLKSLNVEDRVIGMTFSEFGRRVTSNTSLGTDHGTALPMFVFGSKVNPQIFGTNPSLTDLDHGNLKKQYDFRQVYASILSQWFGISMDELNTVMLNNFEQIPIIQSVNSVQDNISGDSVNIYPNPAQNQQSIEIISNKSDVINIELFDINGNKLKGYYGKQVFQGNNTYDFDLSTIPSGSYFYQFKGQNLNLNRKMIKY
jgi:uncharacterized protein (DUF1501 family)